jgi:23S rRNA (uracil1939-C5)-methyltransferase
MSETFELTVERAVAGGRMLARRDGLVVLVSGAIPGERVRAEVERSASHVTWARTIEVLEASPDRRDPIMDPACGGLSYAHIAYERQRALKSDVIGDAFRRVGRMRLDAPPPVLPSPEQGYRLRARLHVRDGRFGFYREHSHELCDAAVTGQLRPDTLSAVAELLERLGSERARCQAVIVAENLSGSDRILHLELRDDKVPDVSAVGEPLPGGVTGLSSWLHGRVHTLAGAGRVSDTAVDLFPEASSRPVPSETTWSRTAASFFQGNRYMLGALVGHVIAQVHGATVADLYAGVGLFAVAMASQGRRVLAIEGDRTSAADLAVNAALFPTLEPHRQAVEHAAPRLRPRAFQTVVIDPPRTGLSREAMAGLLGLAAPRIVFVSCDVATLARDAAKLTQQGYELVGLQAFDMFPNTGHVETVAVFDSRVRN